MTMRIKVCICCNFMVLGIQLTFYLRKLSVYIAGFYCP